MDLYRALQEMVDGGERGALATVVACRGSTPRKAGARMLIRSDGEIVGTIGGGCVEAEVWQQAREVQRCGEPRLFSYSLTADLAADSGMICGGVMDLFIEPVGCGEGDAQVDPLAEVVGPLLEVMERGERAALATVLKSDLPETRPGSKLLVREDGGVPGGLAGSPFRDVLVEECRTLLRQGGENRVVRCRPVGEGQPEGALELFLEVVRRRPRAIVVGAGHVGVHVCRIAAAAGFDVTVVDDRADFASPERFPEAERVLLGGLAETLAGLNVDGDSYVVLVTRGHREDEIALRQVVASPAAYVGMIGSRSRVRTVRERLIRDGFPREAVDRVYAPIGLDIGAETPEEIALSIVAEMARVRRGGSGRSLRDSDGREREPSGSARDAAELRQAEGYLLRTGRLAAIGRLAAALAHEINNPLQGLASSLELVLGLSPEEVKRLEATQTEDGREQPGSAGWRERSFHCGSVVLYPDRCLAKVGGDGSGARRCELTASETELLAYLMQQPDRVLSCRELARASLGYEVSEREAEEMVRPYISRLRKKIELAPANPALICTVRGKGYYFCSR